LQAARTARVLAQGPGGSPRVRLDDHPTGAWLRIRDVVHGHGRGSRAERDMLDRLDRPCTFASALIGDGVVAVGRAVADSGWAGVFGMATLPGARGKGAARGVLAALAGWAGAHGASCLYLQVERDNIPARRLYERAGFREVCAYHYRAG
jgi:GNAT superfamily N-acetyltransferase